MEGPLQEPGGQRDADRIIRAFSESKLANDIASSYADDGRTAQCYHTPETIKTELAESDLEVERLEKIYYPWELVRRFDYGYFPDAREEIWDWYLIARKSVAIGSSNPASAASGLQSS